MICDRCAKELKKGDTNTRNDMWDLCNKCTKEYDDRIGTLEGAYKSALKLWKEECRKVKEKMQELYEG